MKLPAPLRRWSGPRVSGAGAALLAALVVVGLLGLNVEARRTWLLWSGLFGLAVVSRAMARAGPLACALRRSVPGRVVAGAPAVCSVSVENLGSEALDGLVLVEAEPSARAAVPPLAPGERTTVRLTLTFPERGVFHLEGLRLERPDPFMLWRPGRTFPAPATIIAVPRTVPVRHLSLSAAAVHQPGGVPLASRAGLSTEFMGLRDYRPGDPLRHLSWKAFARRGQPVVLEHQAEYFPRAALVLDTRVGSGRREGDHFEAAVSVAASLACHLEEQGFLIDLFAAGPQVLHRTAGRALGSVDDILDLLACVEPCREPTFPAVAPLLRDLHGSLGSVVLVGTDWWPESGAFARSLTGVVPEVLALVVRPDPPRADPAQDLPDPALHRRVNPAELDGGWLSL